jgi:bifunctional DNA-binding transcriptional regulator/antitoxin component of YhaV-PrlF toxin-antitoxin module
MPNVVGERFQITVNRHAREQLGIKPGDLAVERVDDGRLIVTFVPAPHRRSQLGVLRHHARRPIKPIDDWAAYRDGVWSRRTEEIVEALRDDSERHSDERD